MELKGHGLGLEGLDDGLHLDAALLLRDLGDLDDGAEVRDLLPLGLLLLRRFRLFALVVGADKREKEKVSDFSSSIPKTRLLLPLVTILGLWYGMVCTINRLERPRKSINE